MNKFYIDKLTFYSFYVVLTFVFSYNLNGQTGQIVDRQIMVFSCPVKTADTLNNRSKIFIRGRVTEKQNVLDFIPYSTVFIKGTKIYSMADSLGYYSLDITNIADTTNKLTIVCTFINHINQEIIISNKVLQTTIINFEIESKPSCEFHEVIIKQKGKSRKRRNTK
jgi:hypothetical protein